MGLAAGGGVERQLVKRERRGERRDEEQKVK